MSRDIMGDVKQGEATPGGSVGETRSKISNDTGLDECSPSVAVFSAKGH